MSETALKEQAFHMFYRSGTRAAFMQALEFYAGALVQDNKLLHIAVQGLIQQKGGTNTPASAK